MTISLVVGIAVLVVKATALLLTGSSAILSDTLESVVHVLVVATVYYLMRVSLRPPDRDHPYGHGRVEFVSVGFEGGLVLLAGLGIIGVAVHQLFTEVAVRRMGVGFVLALVAGLINAGLGLYLLRAGRRSGSSLLLADAHHVLSDVWTSLAVALGVGVIYLTGSEFLDPLIAIAAGLLIVFQAVRLLRRCLGGLMDESDPDLLRRLVAVINRLREPEWTQLHALRYHDMGPRCYVDFHLVLPGEWTITRYHELAARLEREILAELGRDGAVIVHADPRPAELPRERRGDFTVEEAVRAAGDEHAVGASQDPL